MQLYERPDYRATGMNISREAPTELPVSISEFKTYAKISHDKQDSVIEAAIRTAEDMLFKHGNVLMLEQPVTIAYELGGARCRYPAFPVKSVDKVKTVDPTDGSVTELSLHKDYEIVNQQKTCVELNRAVESGQIVIELTGGYAPTPSEVAGTDAFAIQNLASALYTRDNKQIQEQLKAGLDQIAPFNI